MSSAPNPKPQKNTVVRLRPASHADAEKAVALKKLAGIDTNLSQFTSDVLDAVTTPLLRSAGVVPAAAPIKPKVTKSRNG